MIYYKIVSEPRSGGAVRVDRVSVMDDTELTDIMLRTEYDEDRRIREVKRIPAIIKEEQDGEQGKKK